MPKRSTQTYSSEDAPEGTDAKIHVYYCKYSGDHVLITDAVLNDLPKRKTDNARVLDTQKYVVRLKAQQQDGAKLIKRGPGKYEKQYRYLCGDLPVCYRSEPEGRYVYIIDGALSAFNFTDNVDGDAVEGETPVPPCIQQTSSGTVQIAIEIEDKVQRRSVTRISADDVGIAVHSPAHAASDELVEFMGKILHLRLPQMSLLRGWSTRSKLLMVQGLSPHQVYTRLKEAMEENQKRIQRLVAVHSADNKYINKPEVEKMDTIDPEFLKREIKAPDKPEAYDEFRVKGGAAQHQSAWADEENGPMNVYMGKDNNAGMNWNDAGPHKLDATTGHF